jgi:hypothetical protein
MVTQKVQRRRTKVFRDYLEVLGVDMYSSKHLISVLILLRLLVIVLLC